MREFSNASSVAGTGTAAGLRVVGGATAYRLLDVGYSVSLDVARSLLAARAPERVRPLRSDAAALVIQNPPLSLTLGVERVTLGGRGHDAEVAARIYDFGVISLRVRVPMPDSLPWDDYVAFGRALDANEELQQLLERHARLLFDRISAAIERPQMASVREDYVVFRLREMRGADDVLLGSSALLDAVDLAPLLLNESAPLHPDARSGLLQHRFSYYANDLAVLTWDNALVLDPSDAVTDVEYILEFANAQLLELRYYDAVLDDESQKLYERVQSARRQRLRLTRRYSRLLGDIQRLFADSTELVERVENSLKVTDDVFLGRVYSAALEIFRGRAWRDGVYRKLTLVRETYEMLNAEAQASRSEALEAAIVVLIVFEIVMAMIR